MKYNSVSDIIGPIMIGPSSSHTAGAVRIGQIARSIYGAQPEEADILFYGSFAHTFKGHGTDVAIVGGLLGLSTYDTQIPRALELAKESGIKVRIVLRDEPSEHPNTARIRLKGKLGNLDMVGISVGGGSVQVSEINGFRVRLDGDVPTMLIMHEDKPGVIASVTDLLADNHINISHMEVSRSQKGKSALMVIETDEPISHEMRSALRNVEHVQKVIQIRI